MHSFAKIKIATDDKSDGIREQRKNRQVSSGKTSKQTAQAERANPRTNSKTGIKRKPNREVPKRKTRKK